MEHERSSVSKNEENKKKGVPENYEKLQKEHQELLKEKEQVDEENKRLKSSNNSFMELVDKLQNQHIQTQNQLRMIIMLMAESNPIRDSLDVAKIIQSLAKQVGEEYGGLVSPNMDWSNSKTSDGFKEASPNRKIDRDHSGRLLSQSSSSTNANDSHWASAFGVLKKTPNKSNGRGNSMVQQAQNEKGTKLMSDLMRNSKSGKVDEAVYQAILKKVNGYEKKHSSRNSSPSPNSSCKSIKKKESVGGFESENQENLAVSPQKNRKKEENNAQETRTSTKSPRNFKKVQDNQSNHVSTPLKLE